MSKISTIVDAVRTRLSTVLTDHTELYQSRNIIDNDVQSLQKGQVLQIGPGLNTNRQVGCKLSINRTIVVTITRQTFGTYLDLSTKKTVEKDLLEDQFLVIEDIEKEPTIQTEVAKIQFVGDNGIEEVFVDQEQFLQIQSTFEFEYFEDIT